MCTREMWTDEMIERVAALEALLRRVKYQLIKADRDTVNAVLGVVPQQADAEPQLRR